MHAENSMEMDHITARVIGAAYRVQNELGCGFLEKVYENALCVEIARSGLPFQQQAPYYVRFGGVVVGEQVVVEVRACIALNRVHRMQCLNYLKASGLKPALLFNFGTPRLDFSRIVHGL